MNTIVLASIPAILGIVNLAKDHVGMSKKWAAPLAAGLGVGFGVADYALLSGAALTASGYYSAAGGGLLLGLAAVGLYDVAGRASATVLGGSPTTVVAESPQIEGGGHGAT